MADNNIHIKAAKKTTIGIRNFFSSSQTREKAVGKNLSLFHNKLREQNYPIFIYGVNIFNGFYLGWIVFDFFLSPSNIKFFFILRAACCSLNYIICFLVSRKSFRRYTYEAFMGIMIIYGVFTAFMLPKVTDNFLPYVLGFTLPVLGPGIIPIWYPAWTVIIILVQIAAIPVAFLFNPAHVAFRDTISGLFFIFTAIAISVFTSIFKYRLANKEFFTRQELNEERLITEKLKALDKLKDDFLSNTSHELKTPLNGIIGLADSLMDGAAGEINLKARNNLAMITSSGKRLLHLVNDILDFSKMKNSQLELQLKPVDIRTAASLVLELLKPIGKNKGLRLVNEISSETPLVMADENRLQQILYNLAGNALKFTHEGEVRIGANKKGEKVIVCVSDTGIGVPMDKQDVIFNEFEQADGTISREYGGTGLGLSITRRLVELHGGKIWVESESGKGSLFYFSLPASLDEEASIDRRNKEKNKDFKEIPIMVEATEAGLPYSSLKRTEGNGSILVVDDEPVNVQVLLNQLELVGYTVLNAPDGIQALEIINSENVPDIILLDVMMPRMSGYEVARKLREKFPLYELPIIMLTAKDQVVDIVTGLESGANDYLAKPFDRRELIARVQNLLMLKKSFQEHQKLTALEQDLDIAGKVQASILTPPKEYKSFAGMEIDVIYHPMNSKVSGDYYNISKTREGVTVIIADAAGHGLQAAMSTMQMDLIYKESRNILYPDERLEFINHTLSESKKGQNFFTSFMVNILPDKIIYSSAAHPAQYLIQKVSGRIISLKTKGGIIGMLENNTYEMKNERLEQGDLILLFTDGLLEEYNNEGDEFGETGFQEFLEKTVMQLSLNGNISTHELNKTLLNTLDIFQAGQPINDDITLVTIRIL